MRPGCADRGGAKGHAGGGGRLFSQIGERDLRFVVESGEADGGEEGRLGFLAGWFAGLSSSISEVSGLRVLGGRTMRRLILAGMSDDRASSST